MSSDGIATALQDSASALMAGGNNLEQATALVAAANRVVQDPNSVGSALRTISLRLRGTSVEILEEMGEETEGVIESTSKLQKKIEALSGVDILTDAGDYKDTYTILKEIGKVWEGMSDIDQAALLELMAGKNRANTLSAILSNMKDLEGAYESAMNAEGSALAENETHLDSIQGRIELFTNEVQTFWMNTIESDTVKGIVDLGTNIIDLVDKIGLLPTALGGVLLYFTAIKKNNPATLFKNLSADMYNYGAAIQNLKSMNSVMGGNIGQMSMQQYNAGPINAYAAAVQNLTAKQQASALASAGLTKAQIQETMAKNGVEAANIQQAISETNVTTAKTATTSATVAEALALTQEQTAKLSSAASNWIAENSSKQLTLALMQEAVQHGVIEPAVAAEIIAKYNLAGANNTASLSFQGLGASIKAMMASNPIGWIMLLVSGVIMLVSKVKQAREEIDRAANDAVNTYKEAQKTLKEQKTTIDDLSDSYEKLSKGVDLETNENVNLTTDSYQEYLSICNDIAEMYPHLVAGFDAQGNAILSLKGNVDELTQSYKDSAQAARQQMIASNSDIFKAFSNTYDYIPTTNFGKDKAGIKHQLKLAEEMQRMINEDDQEAYSMMMALLANGDYELDGDRYSTVMLNAVFDSAGIENNLTNQSDFEEFKKQSSKLVSFIKAQTTKINTETLKVKSLMHAYLGEDEDYNVLSDQNRAMVEQIVNGLDAEFISQFDNADALYSHIKTNIIDALQDESVSQAINNLSELQTEFQIGNINYGDYKKQRDEYIAEIQDDFDAETLSKIKIGLGIDEESLDPAINHIKEILSKEVPLVFSEPGIDSLSLTDLKIAGNLDVPAGSIKSWGELIQKINEVKKTTGENIIPVKTYASLTESVNSINEALSQTSEIVVNGTEVTQEYKDSLSALGISATELNECFYESNPLVVKNVTALNKLIKSTKTNIAQNAKLAKSQARLQYYELYREMSGYINATGEVTKGENAHILMLYQEMNALEKTISQYSRLETQLLGAVNAYEKFELAQESDAESDYMSNAEEMVVALGEAFSTAELGTETARAAIAGLIPESIYQDIEALDTVDAKMAAIYDYFKNGKIAQYFSLEFDDDGAITSAEMKLGNLRNFIEDGLAEVDGVKVFEGTDWQHFEFSESFLGGLKEAEDKLQYFADSMGVTKEIAFAFIESINDHDIEWLNGDYSSMFDALTPESLENSIFSTTQKMADLNAQLASGKISANDYLKSVYGLDSALKAGVVTQDEYDQAMQELNARNEQGTITLDEYHRAVLGLSAEEDGLAEIAKRDAKSWYEKNEQLDKHTKKLQEYYDMLETGTNADGTAIDVNTVKESIETTMGEINTLTEELAGLEEPTELTLQFALDDIQRDLDDIEKEIGEVIEGTHYEFNISSGKYKVMLDESDPNYQKVVDFVNLLNEQHVLNTQMGEGAPDVVSTLQTVNDTLTNIQKLLEAKYNLTVSTDGAVTATSQFKDMWDGIKDKSVTLWATVKEEIQRYFSRTPDEGDGEEGAQQVNGTANIRGTAHAKGTAYKSGDWGLSTSEHNALVGELGQELVVNPHTGRYYTVGDSGAEMVDLPQDAIIFNHKQTEGLLKNGHIGSRGKAYAGGNVHAEGAAHVTIWPNASSSNQWTGTGYSGPNDSTYDAADSLSDAADSVSDAADEFREVFDWIEVRLEEINEKIDLKSAQLENNVGYAAKNNTIDQIIEYHKALYDNLIAGANKYYAYAKTLLAKVPSEYRDAAQDGTIAIEEFVGEVDEKTLEAIQNYREWVQKGADVTQQAQETLTAIRDLAIQKIDNAQESGDVRVTIQEDQTEKLQNAVDLDEERGLITSPSYYAAMMVNSKQTIGYLTEARDAMQAEFDEAVKSGQIKRGSNEWYEQIDKLYEMDSQIDQATIELEEFQNAINDIYWDNFDELINRLEYLRDETQSLIDLMDSADMVITPETDDGWSADQVEWTKEGIASMGLHAQQMELAEFESKQYAKAIDDLNADYKKGKYSESEYLEKLNDLTQKQYDAIEAAEEEKQAIVELNEQRIDAIKEGIEKEIDAYEELIQKKKEELDTEKDLYNFQKSVAEGQKNIAEIQRKLAALSGDNSASAVAKRRQLEAELLEAQQAQEELYYDRSVTKQQEALDKELEDFQNEKDAEIEKWEEYLTNVEQVVTDSLGIVQANAMEIGNTLTEKTQEYNLTVSDAVLSPWQDGALAISEYTTIFGDSVSSTTDQLETLKNKWQEVIDKMTEASRVNLNNIEAENAGYYKATYQKPQTQAPSTKPDQKPENQQKAISVGGKINAKGAKIYGYAGDKSGENQYYSSDPIYVVLGEQNGYLKVRHHKLSSGVSGWFKKSDVKAYAKGAVSVSDDQWAWIDELGEELQLIPGQNGRLEYVKKGTGIVPANLTERLMDLAMNPQEVLDRSRPQIAPSKSIINNNMEISVDASVGTLIHVDHLDGNNPDEITKIVNKAYDKKMQELNGALKKFVR